MKQGPFAPTGLCCPGHRHYYDPLRLPLGRPPLPVAGYRRARFPVPAGPGPRRVSPVPRTTFRPFRAPYAGGFLGTCSRTPGAFRGLRPRGTGSAPPWPRLGGNTFSTLQASLHAADRPVVRPLTGRFPALRTRVLTRARRVHYRRPWRLCGPDSHRLAALGLSLGYLLHHPSGHKARATGRTPRFVCADQPREAHAAFGAGRSPSG
jgi:hypothetical protein